MQLIKKDLAFQQSVDDIVFPHELNSDYREFYNKASINAYNLSLYIKMNRNYEINKKIFNDS